MRSITNDALLAVAEHLGVQTLPPVLAVGPRQDRYEEFRAARDHATAGLHADGIINRHGEVDTELADALLILAQPECELVARSYTADITTRVCVARRATHHAVAVRIGEEYHIGTIWCDGSPAALTAPLLAALGACDPADAPGFSAPTGELAIKLDNADHTDGYTNALYALGSNEREARILGSAFGSCRGFTEIVTCTHTDGVTTRAPGAVAIYDTARGRIVAAPLVSLDQQIWTTLTTGTDHRITQAVAALLEGLPGGGWPTP
ncbi:ESX secretion-associated protein EspG [Nocardia jinanensis]|uniref:ESX secretion-associated protein EspG n=1 Tax=Nocardia jinanensis TaxID=382504 RepID=A0A917RBY6_9NOCA|nr:ESX secretion-associated protein EspG [Nocardia jinanensis]GGK98682.1 hypothetical protein GCM10011588_11570 [Nocardia jinanensis]